MRCIKVRQKVLHGIGLFLFLLLLPLSSCKNHATLTVGPSNPPLISISGDGRVDWVWVFGPYTDIGHAEKAPLIWKVDVEAPALFANSVPPFMYGTVPVGCSQSTPTTGSPPQLLEGGIYKFQLVMRGNNSPATFVIVRRGQLDKIEYRENGP